MTRIPDAPIPGNFPEPGVPIEGTNYLELCRLIMDIREDISKGKESPDFQVSIMFGGFEFEGSIDDLTLQDMKDEGNEAFPGDKASYWVLDSGLVSGFYSPGQSLSIVIATDRTESVPGE